MLHVILCILKVLFRNGETVVNIIQEIIQEVKGTTEIQADLNDLEARTIPVSDEVK